MLSLMEIERALAAIEARKGSVRSEWKTTMHKARKSRKRGRKGSCR